MIKDDPSVIKPALSRLKDTFSSGKTLDINYRKQQLRNLMRGIKELESKLHAAVKQDLHHSTIVSTLYSVGLTVDEVKLCLHEIDKWVKPISTDTPALFAPAKSYLCPEPYGVALIIGAWNFPLILTIGYLADAIAAGNCVVIKPSELSAHCSNVMKELITNYLDQDAYTCIEGAIQVSQAITKEPFDIIMFTGGIEKGKLVAKAAAENLVPCILELGGKSPTIIGKEADLENASLKIARARLLNAGQACVACDYVFVHRDLKTKFVEAYKQKTIQFYGQDASKSPDYARIINIGHTKRLKSYLDEDHGGKVLMGGQVNVDDKYVAPTLVYNPRPDSQMMQDEIFGPILPIYEFINIEEVINFINKRSKPLAMYYYGSEKSEEFKQIKARTSSGALVCNDSFSHLGNKYLPFGGVGASGYGNVMGYHSFKAFSHFKPVMECNTNNRFPASALFPPYNDTTKKVVRFASKVSNLKQSHLVSFLIFVTLALILLVFFTQGFGAHTGHIMKEMI